MMNGPSRTARLGFLLALMVTRTSGQDVPLEQPWDYAPTIMQIADRFQGRPGVVLHVGDSSTYSNPYGQ